MAVVNLGFALSLLSAPYTQHSTGSLSAMEDEDQPTCPVAQHSYAGYRTGLYPKEETDFTGMPKQ